MRNYIFYALFFVYGVLLVHFRSNLDSIVALCLGFLVTFVVFLEVAGDDYHD